MDNAYAAQLLREIALLKQIKGDNPFKVRAFDRVARALEGLGEPLSAVAARDELTTIDGVGQSIAGDLQEMVDTGTSSLHQRLVDQLDAGLLVLTKIQGLGPKRIKKLYDELDITSPDQLREAAESGAVEALDGFGKKTAQNILSELDRIDALGDRTPLPAALRFATRIHDALAALDAVERCHIAGSIRRGRETIGDVDILCTAADPEPVFDAFVSLPDVADVIARGPTKTSVRLRQGLQVDVRIVDDSCFGAALHYFTGSKEHHVKLRGLAKRRGLKISEYGVFRDGDEAPIAAASEADIYAALELPWIPPELRQGGDEIERAQEGTLPELIDLSDVRGDVHMHTTETDGKATAAEMVEAARALGYTFIAITDHSQAVSVANGMTPARFRAQIAMIRELDASLDDFTVLSGIEVDILRDGSLDMDHDLLADCDWVVGSVHSHFNLSESEMTARLVRACESGLISCLGHPTGRILGGRDGYRYDLEAVLEAAAEFGVAVEINGSSGRLDFNAEHARYAHRKGVRIALSSDAHSTRGLSSMRYAAQQARRAGLGASQILNCLTPAELLAAVRPALHAPR